LNFEPEFRIHNALRVNRQRNSLNQLSGCLNMKKQIASFVVLAIIVFSFLNFAYKILPAARATPVEGTISQDTLWTLVDSPFVVTNDIVVNLNVALTIEPGVEVRFGGEFSIIVVGKIIAQGTEARKIRFTTNDPSGDNYWKSIAIYGAQSSFRQCIIEYGTNATVVETGSLDIQQCTVQLNSENGLVVNGGIVNVNGNEFAFNGQSAIQISGGSSVAINNNIIKSNTNGLTLSRFLTGTVRIQQNEISNNTDAGVAFAATVFTDTLVSDNHVTLNGYGFLIETNVTTNIVRNYIFRNSIGVYYIFGGYHQLNSNDIYENQIGVDLSFSSKATVNAVHNYWGDRTGPKHQWLNPHGKGNIVGGDGVNLEFIPFYNHPFAYSNNPPTAILWTDLMTVAVGQTVTLVGTDSQDDGSVFRYYFFFNDTTDSGWTTLSLYNHTYTTTGTFAPSLIVEDDVSWWSTQAFATINVVNLRPLQTSVTTSDSTIAYNGETWVTVFVSDGGTGVASANVELFSVGGGTFDSQSGSTDANGYFSTKFTAPNVTETIDARIIARASTSGYADGSGHEYVKILSPLRVEATSQPSTVNSEGNTTLNVLVKDNFDDPVEGSNLTILSDYGTITPTTTVTDSNGTATFTYSAPKTLSPANATITIRASKNEYADGQLQTYINVEPKLLSLDLTAEPSTVFSEDPSTITARVTFDSTVVTNSAVTAFSDVGGNFSETLLYTDLTGTARFAFTAPQTVTLEGTNVTITVRAVKDGFVEAQNQITLPVQPKTLDVQVIPDALTTNSGGKINVTVNVGYNGNPIENANVTTSSENGNFEPALGVTDKNGNVTFVFTAPEINQETNVNISVIAMKTGYIENTDELGITVNPRTFSIFVNPSIVQSGRTETFTIHIVSKEDNSPTEAAVVTFSFKNGEQFTNVTDSQGTCTFIAKVPETSDTTVNLTVTATRIGYKDSEVEIVLNNVPAEGGFPWLLILAIVIPIAVVAFLIVMIKTKKMVVSSDEEQGSE
jgi:hypothetical protein